MRSRSCFCTAPKLLLMSSLVNALLSEENRYIYQWGITGGGGIQLFVIGLLTCTWGGRQR
jgi:hypothetical protein